MHYTQTDTQMDSAHISGSLLCATDAGYLHFFQAYLTLSSESSLLQSGPDALNASRMLRVAVGVAAHALMLLHQGVIHEALETHGNIHYTRSNARTH